ncbi:Adenylate and Guanylate cyclase catalytic domain containing protein [Histomonas meleagridis]|uniref:Adenylate and Guanylate cyclase catalytic domain containing protein n=1 Tax=Histomonas meleagridis TaxID=135588 RepID=UPI003559DF33|nr:Adenylate and Guanylate cyclase catalytic domain containing protein [Histomonas meleagridis]KAH0797615.1 Adenylate and Guanylate cyclase catalytic domain containing protein [Histomonas meleagridis]
MVTKLLSKNQVLHSKISRATFMFFAIADFLKWCSNTQIDIVDFLDEIVSMFDKLIAKYQSLVKIKIINGVYMAAGGLFDVTKNQETEMIDFAIDCIKWIKLHNKELNIEINYKVGINTDGPIIAGILGHDKPFFDVYGDAVNVASRLCTSAPINCIQISEDLKNNIPHGKYKLKRREKVFLKGKGECTTYIVCKR